VKHPILIIAVQEFTLNRRNRWVESFAFVFALLTLIISYFGMITSGYSGFQDFARTATSLVKISGFLIPLFALLLGVFSFISNKEYLELLVTQPISRFQVIVGKYFGLILTLIAATIIGFAIPGIIISLNIGTEGAVSYGFTILFTMLLGVVFIGIAILISHISNRQQIAIGIAIGIWIFFEVVYGIIILGTTLYFSPQTLKIVLLAGLFCNPIDIMRVLSLITVGGLEFFGPAGATLYKIVGSEVLTILYGVVALVLWIIIPLLFSSKIFNRQNL
jgi:Cu-processing system permease protein